MHDRGLSEEPLIESCEGLTEELASNLLTRGVLWLLWLMVIFSFLVES